MATPLAPPPVAVPLLLQPDHATRRWRLDSWAFWRAGSGASSAAGIGRLGGSQLGARLDFDLTPRAPGRVAAYTRVSAALDQPASPELALGLAYQPSRSIPITLAAERRVKLGNGARNATALYAAGGFGPTTIGPSLQAEGYTQAGMVGLRSRDLFIDGKLSVFTPVPQTRVNLGASLSGGAQPDLSRLDIGPEVHVRLPLPRVQARLALEWRERIAGRAAPRSGFALTLAADF